MGLGGENRGPGTWKKGGGKEQEVGKERINHLKAMVTQHNSVVWPVPYACTQPNHPGSGSHGQLLFRPS